MARNRSRIEKLRAPFVVTVALGASACGGVTTSHDPNEKPLTGADGGPSQAGCPTVAPVNGDPCAVPSGTKCSQEATCSEPQGYSAECVVGVWQVQPSIIACNPPPPPTTVCPVAQPGSGDYCDYVGAECLYGSSPCPGVSAYGATCQQHQWSVVPLGGGCNPPAPPPCPTVAPLDGQQCFVSPATTCSQTPSCVAPGFEAHCVSGVWQVVTSITTCNPPAPWPYDSGLPWVSIEGGVAIPLDGGAAPPSP